MDKNKIKEIYLQRKSYQSLEVDDTDIQLKYILEYIPEDHNTPILDAGCGNGKRALKLHKSGYRNISGIDLFDAIPVTEIKYIKASIEDLPFDDNVFQFIFAMSVIYYLPDPEKAIQEFSRVLQHNGILLMTAHTKYSLFTLRRVIMRLLRRKVVRHLQDVKFRSAGEYIEILRRHNFEIIRVDGFNLSFFFVPLYNLIRKFVFKLLRINLPRLQSAITANKFCARMKSIFAYHLIIVAKKK